MLLSTLFGRRPKVQHAAPRSRSRRLFVEQLEDRCVPSAFNVTTLSATGAGSLDQAITDANRNAGADVINFQVAGTITLTSGALPVVTDVVDIRGNSAPGYAGTPIVQVDFNNFGGLKFAAGSSGSAVRSMSLVDARDNGIAINGGGFHTIVGNYIGVNLDGTTAAGNRGNGIQISNSGGNTIGGVAAHDRNVISGNRKNGIALITASDNNIVGNYIGTDALGLIDLGNSGNGILVSRASARNVIGGEATGGNDPTNGVFVKPPQGNLISGNNADGVFINAKSTHNRLSGNFIGTDVTGNVALGNSYDGVAIRNANDNGLIGCNVTTDPFVFYNVISGNGANGVRITSSDRTTIQANFVGIGADNQSAVGNGLNGVVVEGTSTHTIMGGPIPLGNVVAANGKNGIVVRDTASFFTSYNTFCGLAAFETYEYLGNGANGMLITSSGGNILIRTNVITENGNNGIKIGGEAQGVRVAGNIIGMDTNGNAPMGNKNNGIEIAGNAHHIIVGGPQKTFNIIPHNVISANQGSGVAIVGNATDIRVNYSYIGTDLDGLAEFGNHAAGIYLGAGTSNVSIGSSNPNLITVISGNDGNGIEMNGTRGNSVIGSLIGTDRLGVGQLGNQGNGIEITNSSNNMIGGRASDMQWRFDGSNVIAYNELDGVHVVSGRSNAIRQTSIYENGQSGIELDPGANRNQSAPVLTSAVAGTVSGTLTSRPNATYVVDLYSDDQRDASGHYYLGSMKVRTNAFGVAHFTFASTQSPVGARYYTATATDTHRNTSEFSAVL